MVAWLQLKCNDLQSFNGFLNCSVELFLFFFFLLQLFFLVSFRRALLERMMEMKPPKMPRSVSFHSSCLQLHFCFLRHLCCLVFPLGVVPPLLPSLSNWPTHLHTRSNNQRLSTPIHTNCLLSVSLSKLHCCSCPAFKPCSRTCYLESTWTCLSACL